LIANLLFTRIFAVVFRYFIRIYVMIFQKPYLQNLSPNQALV